MEYDEYISSPSIHERENIYSFCYDKNLYVKNNKVFLCEMELSDDYFKDNFVFFTFEECVEFGKSYMFSDEIKLKLKNRNSIISQIKLVNENKLKVENTLKSYKNEIVKLITDIELYNEQLKLLKQQIE